MNIPNVISVNRRTAVKTIFGAGVAWATSTGSALAQGQSRIYDIKAVSRILEVKGRAAKVFGLEVDGGLGGLVTRYGPPFRARVTNQLTEDTLIHWHGLTPPHNMDGVPMVSGPVLKPGESREFSFENSRTGTHWMHSHVGLQEQQLLAAPLIVQEAGDALVDEQEHVVMLHDFTFRDPQEILAELQDGGGLHAGHQMAAAHKMPDGSVMTSTAGAGARLSDIAYDAMLANDRTLDDPEVIKAERGGRFRLRIINGAAASNFWIDLGDIEGALVAVDGNGIYPVKGRRFPLAIAQRADIRLTLPPGNGAWPVFFHAEGSRMRSGIILQAGDGEVRKFEPEADLSEALDLALEAGFKSVYERPEIAVSRTDFVMLTGGGSDYKWGLNGKSTMHDVLFSVRQGERYEIVMHNMTGMAHPMHLHGHYFKVVGVNGQRFDGALRDTVLVPPNMMVAIQFDADNPGTWAFHCHHIYHMNAGMMGAIAYISAA